MFAIEFFSRYDDVMWEQENRLNSSVHILKIFRKLETFKSENVTAARWDQDSRGERIKSVEVYCRTSELGWNNASEHMNLYLFHVPYLQLMERCCWPMTKQKSFIILNVWQDSGTNQRVGLTIEGCGFDLC